METQQAVTQSKHSALVAFQRERPQLFGIAYRMLGSVGEAEDVLQEAYLRWHGVAHAEVDNAGAFLVRMVTRLCLDVLKSARHRRLEYVGPWLPEPLVRPDMHDPAGDPLRLHELADDLSFALLVTLERLSPVERAVFLLRESFDFGYAEIAAVVGKSEEACRQIGHRARKRLAAERRGRPADPAEHDRLLQRFLQATREGDVQGLVELLARDAVAYADGGGRASTARNPIRGAEHVARYLAGLARKASTGAELRPAWVNGRTGVLTYLAGELRNVLCIDVEDGRVRHVFLVVNPDKLPRAR